MGTGLRRGKPSPANHLKNLKQAQIGNRHRAAPGGRIVSPFEIDQRSQPLAQTNFHFRGRFVGEGEEEDLLWQHAIGQKISDAINQRSCLAAASTRDDQRLSRWANHGGVLLGIQLRAEVDLWAGIAVGVKSVLACHERALSIAGGRVWQLI